ncbi:DNA-binding transcriptional regulator, LysR family [Roseovarius nanhaiticus]|uniref:DNA-binding transcriptional regulator, LysR family n=1 Tax=Roseovarius nanhaiticus TaxID=573024 RepID=A0A1N7H872_9RHOB|nr:LysR family transcriptional regulator [Roseovarius nanhaiticus]SEL09853.1 DNA-binding transcriptional regulator, LysR family [Roseovarius nanhaiticus]SIS20890.1 DNA-binding transcriptional regulator, LysR family [Roseovarius nanhaiticus]
MERSFNINTLTAFLTVAREGSVSRAAEVLHLTQPAVSHQIKRLSEETGTALFERSPTGLRLTREGAALIPEAQKVVDAVTAFRRSAVRQAERVGGTLRIGTIVDPEFIRLGHLLGHLRRDYPDIQTELVHGVSGEIFARLQRKQIDAGYYLSSPEEAGQIEAASKGAIRSLKLAQFDYRVIAPVGWEARVESAGWPELAKLPWIGTPEASAHHRLLRQVFAAEGCNPNIVALVDQEASMLEMVRSGVGLSLCRESIALHQRQSYGLAVAGAVSIPACLSFAMAGTDNDSPAKDALWRLVERVWR